MNPSRELKKIALEIQEEERAMGGVIVDIASDYYKDLGNGEILLLDSPFNKEAVEYKGKKVKLNKPRYLREGEPGYGKKQYVVFVKDGDRVKKITFGDANLRAKPNDPEARKNFRARHRCHLKTDKTTAGYWACRWPKNW